MRLTTIKYISSLLDETLRSKEADLMAVQQKIQQAEEEYGKELPGYHPLKLEEDRLRIQRDDCYSAWCDFGKHDFH